MIGLTFGRLVVGEEYRYLLSGRRAWVCLCICGKTTIAREYQLKSGHTKSCGCLRNETARLRSKTHDKSKSKLYRVWRSMIDRCHNPNTRGYENYGGRGILVCKEWKKSFVRFSHDMGEQNGLTLDRIDNDKGYFPENCRWSDRRSQAINQRKRKNCTSKFKGVHWHKNVKKWSASCDGKYLGYFILEEDAAKAYDAKALEVFGNEATLNFKD